MSSIRHNCDTVKSRADFDLFSAGSAVVGPEQAALWTDGRYFAQAEKQLDENWTLMRQGMPGTPTKWPHLAHTRTETNTTISSLLQGVPQILAQDTVAATSKHDHEDKHAHLISTGQYILLHRSPRHSGPTHTLTKTCTIISSPQGVPWLRQSRQRCGRMGAISHRRRSSLTRIGR